MNKQGIIDKIEDYSANLIWEIDDEKYYGLIGWNGEQNEDSSWWLNQNLKDEPILFLTTLLNKLKTYHGSENTKC